MSVPIVPLGEVCEMDRQGLRPDDPIASRLPFVGVEHVESDSGAFNFDNGSRIGSQRSMTFRFDERHVLYAKLRPYLNKVATPGFVGRCSTELVPLLPRDGVDREFIAFLLRRQETVDYVMSSVTGARMPRTDMKALMSLRVPLPPLDEQRRIVSILNRAAKIERLRAQAQERLQEFIPALFIEMFGDPVELRTKFPCTSLGEASEVRSGATKGRKIAPESAIEVPYLRVANVQDGHLDLSEIKTIRIRRGEEQKYALAPGDLLMTEGGDADKLGRAAIWCSQLDYCAHQNHVFRVRPRTGIVLTDYLRDLAGSAYGRAYFLSVAKRTTGIASINKTQLCNFPVPLPPIEHQSKYAALVEKTSGLISTAARGSTAGVALSASLMDRLMDAAE